MWAVKWRFNKALWFVGHSAEETTYRSHETYKEMLKVGQLGHGETNREGEKGWIKGGQEEEISQKNGQ